MSKSPERTTAPPINEGSTEQRNRTSRRSRVRSAPARRCCWASLRAHGRDDLDVCDVLVLRFQLFEVIGDFGQVIDAAVFREQVEQRTSVGIERVAANPGDQLDQLALVDARTAGERLVFVAQHDSTRGPEPADQASSLAFHARRRRPPARKVSQSWLSRPCVVTPGSWRCRDPSSGLGAFDFARQLLDQVGVSLRIDFTLQQAGCAGDGKTADVLAQRVTGTRLLERDFLLGVTDESLAFRNGSASRFIDDLRRTLVRLVDDLLRLLTGRIQDALGFPVRALQLCLAAFSGSKTFGDLLLAISIALPAAAR